MADNYLEKKMDDYRRGISAMPRRSYAHTTRTDNILPVTPQRVALIINDYDLLRALLGASQRVPGLKVAFTGSDYRDGNRLAQAHGALFVHCPDTVTGRFTPLYDVVGNRWGGIDVVITDLTDCNLATKVAKTIFLDSGNSFRANSEAPASTSNPGVTRIKISPATSDPAAVAAVALLMLSPFAAPISTVTLHPSP